ncbi:MAG: PKD domain-containing protein [Chitinophagia bacterium]|nr:PKD domain-containing protein [Chitinophagia bacterium]
MKLRFIISALIASFLCGVSVKAQIVSGNLFLQGQYLEIGAQNNGSLGTSTSAPSGYHPHTGGPSVCGASNALAHVYDYGRDGWSTGTPPYMGDYSIPGTPWEGWMMEANGSTGFANSVGTGGCGFTGGMGISGSWASYSAGSGVVQGLWTGTALSGALSIRQQYRVDTFGSDCRITVYLVNTTSTPITGVYYCRSLDPDNSQSWSGGSFTTINEIVYQNDFYHRVMVKATATGSSSAAGSPPQPISLGTKDCRAQAFIYTSWPMSTSCTMTNIWAHSESRLGTSYYTVGSSVTRDIAIGIIFNLGTINAYDSTRFSFSYIYGIDTGRVDTAYPEPVLSYAGRITDSVDTITTCAYSGSAMPIDILYGDDRSWYRGDWTWSPITGLSTTTGVHNTIDFTSLSSTTTYTIRGADTALGTCREKVFYLTVVPVTVSLPIVRDTVFCRGVTVGPLNTVTSTGGTIRWYTTATGGTGSTTAPTPSTATLGVTTYWVTQTIAGCESSRIPVRVTIAPPPVVSASNNSPLCPGDVLVLTLTDTMTGGVITYSWTGPSGYTSTARNPTRTGVVFADSGIYYVVVNHNGCATNPTPTLAVIHSTPPSPIFSNPTYCQYLPTVPLSAFGSNIKWYTTATGGVGSTIAPLPSSTIAGTFTWYVTQTINNCESNRYPVVVTINPKPVPPTIINTPGSYCVGDRFNPFTIVSGSNIKWYAASTGGTGSTTAPTVNTAYPGSFTFWASQTLLGCEGDRAPVTVTVYDSVKAHIRSEIHLGCKEDTVYFFNSSYGAINYLWLFGDGYSSADASTRHIYRRQDVYTVQMYAHSLHCLDSAVQTINLIHPDTARFTLAPALVCQGDTVKFTNNSVVTSPTYRWVFGDGSTSNAVNPKHIYNHSGTYRIALIATDGLPCSDTAYSQVTVDSISPFRISVSDTLFCMGTYITLRGDYTRNGLRFMHWSFDNGDTVYNTNPVTYGYSYPRTFTIRGTAHYRVCPPNTDSVNVKVLQSINIDLGPDTTICVGSSSVLLRDYFNSGTAGATWRWNTGERGPSIYASTAGTYYATVRLGGCSATDSVRVFNDCYVTFPNGFSPNRDGVNDHFNPRDYFTKGCKSFKMTIYNRWGQTIFVTDATHGRGWDGTFNGEAQPMGVYVYDIEATFEDGQILKKRGNVTLMK